MAVTRPHSLILRSIQAPGAPQPWSHTTIPGTPTPHRRTTSPAILRVPASSTIHRLSTARPINATNFVQFFLPIAGCGDLTSDETKRDEIPMRLPPSLALSSVHPPRLARTALLHDLSPPRTQAGCGMWVFMQPCRLASKACGRVVASLRVQLRPRDPQQKK